VAVDAVKNFFIPIGWVLTTVKLTGSMPPLVVAVLIGGLVAYIGYLLYGRYRVERERHNRILSYESLVRLLNLPAKAIDHAFTFHELHRRLLIAPPHATLITTDRGRNTSGRNQNLLRRVVTGDAPCEFKALNFQATIDIAGKGHCKAFSTEEMLDGGRKFLVTLAVPGGGIVKPGEKVECRCEFRWPGAVARNEDYWVFPLSMYPNQIGSLEIDCLFERPPKAVHLYRLDDLKDEPVELSEPVTEAVDGNAWTKYTTLIPEPRSPHVLKWTSQ
jgi:hypothetical protein